ncbi:MAG TPA: hypothetical protein VFU15_03585 [Bacteroidia bacterium]|nr:hypothetical protein [Bacteroidia bacterium]
MKALLLLFASFFCAMLFAQDTLVTSRGKFITGYIVAADSTTFSWTTDTASQELNLIPRSSVIAIRHRNGTIEKFFSSDTIVTMEGDVIVCKVMEIGEDVVTYIPWTDFAKDPVAKPASDVFMIRLHNGIREIISHSGKNSDSADYYTLGQNDAKMYYKTPPGTIVAEVASGAATWILIGVVPGAIICFAKPQYLHTVANPNDNLIDTNDAYRRGFEEAAGKKKQRACVVAWGAGVVGLPVVLIGVIIVDLLNNFG